LNTFGSGEKEFEENVKSLVTALFSGSKIPAKIKGSKRQVKAFAEVLIAECAYLKIHSKVGEGHPETVRVYAELDGAIRRFERATGINWPIR
jgi:hypothetical protein